MIGRHRRPPGRFRRLVRRVRRDPALAATLPAVLVLTALGVLLTVALAVLLAAPDLLTGFGAAAAAFSALLYLQVHREGVSR